MFVGVYYYIAYGLFLCLNLKKKCIAFLIGLAINQMMYSYD